MKRRCLLVDVFSDEPLRGNPLAVVVDAEGLSTDDMLSITRWFNFSESTFLLPPENNNADYRVRIFCPEREMPFAGHPTLGSCHAWLAEGGSPADDHQIIQECEVGLVAIRRDAGRLAFSAPPLIRDGSLDADKLDEVSDFLRIDPGEIVDAAWADNGPGWIAVLLASAEAVLALDPVASHPTRMDLGVVGPYSNDAEFAFELRALCTDLKGAVREDPVTGSLNASVAQWLLASNRANSPYIAQQGTKVGRAGKVYVEQDKNDNVWIGGNSTTITEGTIDV